ncbi:sialate:O-sulfotransferase 2-like [Ptychodera flava]|uniref:sialate:O-sulfotransferase 2-like n=1 Tax=Ptychodera flava TaxID=63121 RepID=UPI00396A8A92
MNISGFASILLVLLMKHTAHGSVDRGVFTEYVGCYVDDETRALNWYFYTSGNAMSVEKCISICSSQDLRAPYAGVQNGKQCFCGDTYDIYGKVNSRQCSKECTGNANQYCGGTWRFNAYRLRYAEYIGCFEDQSDRALPVYQQRDDMTVGKCLKFCRDGGYTYAGVQNRKQCFCGSDYNKYGEKKAADCGSHCVGNDNENCGGTWRNGVYRLPPC